MADQVERLSNQGWDSRIQVIACPPVVQAFLVRTRRYLVVVDSLIHPASGRAMLEFAREDWVGRQMIVVNTHADWDHFWGNPAFAAPVVGSRLCRERALSPAARAELQRMQRAEPGRFDEVKLRAPDLTFDGTFVIDGGDLSLELIPTPGHQSDHLVVWIPEIHTLLAGDGAETPFPMLDYPGGLNDLRGSLRAMRDLEPWWVLACHAPPSQGCALIDANLDYFQRMEECCREALARSPQRPEDLEVWSDYPLSRGLEVVGWSGGQVDPMYADAHRRALEAMAKELGADW